MASSQLSECELSKDCRFLFSEDLQESNRTIKLGPWRISRIHLLSIICSLLAILCISLIIFSLCFHASNTSVEKAPQYRRCDRVNCLRQAAEMVGYMNETVSPCANFYQFACGNFDQIHPSGDQLLNTVQIMLENINARRIEDMLTSKQLSRGSFKFRSSALRKLKVFFQTCMNSFSDGDSIHPFLDVIENLGQWSALTGGVKQKNLSDFHNLFEKTRELHGVRLFFTISWLQRNRSVVIETPNSDFVTDDIFFNTNYEDTRHGQRQKLIKETILIFQKETAFNSSGCDETCSPEKIANSIVHFEAKLAKTVSNRKIMFEHNKHVALHELSEVLPSIRWPQLIYLLFGNGIDLNNLTIVLEDPDYLQRLNKVITETNTTTLVNYIYWKVIKMYLPALGPRLAVISQELEEVTSAEAPKSRKSVCYSFLKKYMSRALRGLFLIEHIGVSNIQSVLELFEQVKKQIAETFDWMTPESRKISLQMLSNLSHDFGHAPWVADEAQLDEYYSELYIHSSSFLDNLVEANSFRSKEVKLHLELLINDDEEDHQLWVSGKSEDSDIGYDPIQERLIIRPGALQVPLFVSEPTADLSYMNAAALGSLMLAELAKPFFIYHYTVRTDSWWDSRTESKYDNYKQCLNRSLQGYYLEFNHLLPTFSQIDVSNLSRSTPTLRIQLEPLRVINYVQSQHLSLMLSRNLYSSTMEQTQEAVRLAGVENFTTDQIFYIMFAQTRCQSTHMRLNPFLYAALRQFPMELMINNFFYNDPKFVRAFQCSSIPPQHQKEHCTLD